MGQLLNGFIYIIFIELVKFLLFEFIKEIFDGRLDNSFLDIMFQCWCGIFCYERFVLVLLYLWYKIREFNKFLFLVLYFFFVFYIKIKLKLDFDINIFMLYV